MIVFPLVLLMSSLFPLKTFFVSYFRREETGYDAVYLGGSGFDSNCDLFSFILLLLHLFK